MNGFCKVIQIISKEKNMQKIEIVIPVPISDGLREVMDFILQNGVGLLKMLGFPCSGAVLYNIPAEKEEENG